MKAYYKRTSKAISKLTIASGLIAIITAAAIAIILSTSVGGSPSTLSSIYRTSFSFSSYSTTAASSATSTKINTFTNTSSSKVSNATRQASTGVLVPLFTNVTSEQTTQITKLIQIRLSHPTVPMLVVFDEKGGPGNYSTSTATEIRNMQSAGIAVLGYDPTWWGMRNITVVEQVMLTFHSWYGVNGIFLDQMPNWNYNGPNGTWHYTGPNGEFIPGYFSTLTNYGKSLGLTKIMANAGADVPLDFIGSVDTIGTFENPFLPSLSLTAGWTSIAGLGAWHTSYNKTNFMFFSYNVTSLDPQYVLAAAKYVGYMYITNGTQADDRYGNLSPYLEQLVSLLAAT